MSTRDLNMDVDDLIYVMSNIEVDPNGIGTQMNNLVEQLAHSFVPYSTIQSTHAACNQNQVQAAEAERERERERERNLAEQAQAQAVIGQFSHYLNFEGADLTDAELPCQFDELEVISHYISDELLRRHRAGENRMVVFSPREHPCYPCWVEEHEVNVLIRESLAAMVARQCDAMDMY